MAKELHPDLNASEKAHQYFIIVQNAYHYLQEHPYSKFEIERLYSSKNVENFRTKINLRQTIRYHRNPLSSKTLREILKYSAVARLMYILFHVLFLIMGLYLIYRPVYDIIYYPVDIRVNPISAYLVLLFGFIFGVILTTIFFFTGIKFLRNR